MKRLLFISRSRLCHNLLQEVLSLVPGKMELVALEEMSQMGRLPEGERKFSLVVVDQNCLDVEGIADPASVLVKHPAVATSRKILIYPHHRKPDPRHSGNFEAMAVKPFLPEELASLIEKNLS